MKNLLRHPFLVISVLFSPLAFAASPLETQVFESLNALRQYPASFVPDLQAIRAKLQGNALPIGPGFTFETREGAVAVDDAIKALQAAQPLNVLTYSAGLAHAAQDGVADQVRTGATGHVGSDQSTPLVRMERYVQIGGASGENIEYGFYGADQTGRNMILAWVIDDGLKPRPHRQNLLNPIFETAGVACGQHPQWGTMCTLDLASDVTPKTN